MNPKYDLSAPAVNKLIAVVESRSQTARALSSFICDAVRPVFIMPEHGTTPRQSGSCVIVRFNDQLFVFSASHVFDDIGERVLTIGCGDKLYYLAGDRFSSARGKSGSHQDDPIDSSVLHINGKVPDEISSTALSFDNLDMSAISDQRFIHVAIGFRSSRSRRIDTCLQCEQELYASLEFNDSEYSTPGLERKRFAALAFEEQILVNGKWTTAPSPRGMSGGAIARIEGLPVDPNTQPCSSPVPKLTAIITELRKATHVTPATLLGARVGVHVGLIQKYLPELFES